jgi:hypothetical protein
MRAAESMDLDANLSDIDALVSGFLPTAPANLLLLDAQHGTAKIERDFESKGHRVTTLPLYRHGDIVQFPTATRDGIWEVNIASSLQGYDPFDAVFVLNYSPTVHPLSLFDEILGHVKEGAIIVVAGQSNAPTTYRMLHWLDYVVAIGSRCGFDVQECAPGLVANDNGGYIRIFRSRSEPRWQLRHVRTGDFDEIANLFQEVFGHPISRELWNWKYANGHGNGVVAARHCALIAHYGGMYRNVMLCGKPDWAFQICDVMVHPNERGVMTRQGPFLLTAATSAEIYGPLGFGFPNARAMEVAAKMGLYAEVGQMSEVRWEPSVPRFRLRTRLRSVVRDSAASQALVNSLWEAMASDLQQDVVGVRDWAFVEHRYFNHPHNHYEVLVVTSRLTGKALGVMVLRRLEATCELVDVITPLAYLPLLIDQARRRTGLWGLPSLYCWITKNHLQRFLATGGTEVALNVSIPTSCWTDDPRADIFKDRWWLMSGDTDFR